MSDKTHILGFEHAVWLDTQKSTAREELSSPSIVSNRSILSFYFYHCTPKEPVDKEPLSTDILGGGELALKGVRYKERLVYRFLW